MTASDREFDLLVRCCRWPVSTAVQEVVPGEWAGVDWARFAHLAGRHRVEGLVSRALGVTATMGPPEIVSRLKDRAMQIARQNLLGAVECERLRDAFAGAGIDLLFFKGLTLAVLAYGSIVPKAASDLDILISPDALLPACKLLRKLGYRAEVPRSGDDAALARWHAISKESVWTAADGMTVELHTSLADHPRLIPSIGMSSPRQSVMVGKVEHHTLARDELFAYLCVHGASSAWFRLKWLADLAALLAGADEGETERLHERAVGLGAGASAAAALILAHQLFGVAVAPDRLRTWLRRADIRLLIFASTRSMTGSRGEAELQETFLGSLWIHVAQLDMVPSLAGKINELRRQRLISSMSRRDRRGIAHS